VESQEHTKRLLLQMVQKLAVLQTPPPTTHTANMALHEALAERRVWEKELQASVHPKSQTLPEMETLEKQHAAMLLELTKSDTTLSHIIERRARAMERRNVSAKRMHKFRSRSGDFCDHCQQRVPSEHRERMLRKMQADHKSYSTDFDTVTAEHHTQLQTKRRQCAFLKKNEHLQKMKLRQSAANLAVLTRENAQNRLREIDVKLLELRNANEEEMRRNKCRHDAFLCRKTIQSEVQHLEKELRRIDTLRNPHAERSKSLQLQSTKSSTRLHELESEMKTHEKLFSSAVKLCRHFGKDGIQPALTHAALQRIESLCASYFADLHSNEKALMLDADKYSKNIQVGEWSTPVNLLSGGELRRLQLASFMAFSHLTLEKANLSLDVRVFDEPCSPLDAAGHAAFLLQLKNRYPTHKSVLISHSNVPEKYADHLVKIKCRGLHRSHIESA
jgi:hypothetical protein